MAYLELATAFAGPGVCSAAPVDAETAVLSHLEWSVVALARTDTLGSLQAPGLGRRLQQRLLGARPLATLADPRLEALRRFAVHAWHRGYALPVSELKAFVAAGFSIHQAETALAAIAGAHSGRR